MKRIFRKAARHIERTVSPKFEVLSPEAKGTVFFYGSEKQAQNFVRSNPSAELIIRPEGARCP